MLGKTIAASYGFEMLPALRRHREIHLGKEQPFCNEASSMAEKSNGPEIRTVEMAEYVVEKLIGERLEICHALDSL
jgi:hypothetical protein